MTQQLSDSSDFVKSLTEDKSNPKLGLEVRNHLVKLGLETSLPGRYSPEIAFKALQEGVSIAYKNLGLDVVNDPSIQDTPRRFAAMFIGELTKGLNYDFFPKCTATPNGNNVEVEAATFGKPVQKVGGYDQAVIVKNIRITSLCEHHLQTIDGFAHIAYIPKDKVLGLSKFARVAEFFAARPQIQERMTDQIYYALQYILGTDDIAVVVDAVHYCMRARGVKQPESTTQSDKMGGRFLTNDSLRKEFLDAIG